MAFGYALMKGRAGAAGYIRETGKAREVMARNIPPRAICYLYRHRNGECDLCGAETADSSGNAKWTAPREGSLFIAADNQVLLWEGSDEAFLLANAWLKNQIKREEKNDKTPEESEGTQDNREVSQEISEIKADFDKIADDVFLNRPKYALKHLNFTGHLIQKSKSKKPRRGRHIPCVRRGTANRWTLYRNAEKPKSLCSQRGGFDGKGFRIKGQEGETEGTGLL